VLAVLQSYGSQDEDGAWRLNANENPKQRTYDLNDMRRALGLLAKRLGFQTEIAKNPSANSHESVLWKDSSAEPAYLFYLSASACIQADLLQTQPLPANRCISVIPGGRSQLITLRLSRDPRLAQLAAQGWRFIKFRQVRSLSESSDLTLKTLESAFSNDPPTQQETEQLSLF